MHVPFKHSAALLGASAVFALGGCGSSATQSASSTAGGSSGAATRPQGRPGTPPATQLRSLADALGVSVAKLRSAMESTRPTAGAQPTGDPSAALAKALGISQAKVQQAMQSAMPQGGTPPQGSARTAHPRAARRRRARRRPARRRRPDTQELSQGDQPSIGRIDRPPVESCGTLRWLPTRSGAGHISLLPGSAVTSLPRRPPPSLSSGRGPTRRHRLRDALAGDLLEGLQYG